MKSKIVLKVTTISVVIISLIIAYPLYITIERKKSLSYDLEDMKAIANNEVEKSTLENEINNVQVIDMDFPFLETSIESTASDCSTIGISMFQQYQISTIKADIKEKDIASFQYESNKVIKGDLKDFIIEITFNTRYLEDDATILKEYMNENKNRPFFRTRFHIKATDKPATYELVEIGKDLGN